MPLNPRVIPARLLSRLALALLLSTSLLATGGGCGGDPKNWNPSSGNITLNAGDGTNELRAVRLRPGQTLRLRLRTHNPGPGVAWRVAPESVRELQSTISPLRVGPRKIEQTSGGGDTVIGNTVYHTFRVTALRLGRQSVVFFYDRQNEPSVPPLRKFTLDVTIAQ